MKHLPIFILTLVVFSAFGQETPTAALKRFQIGINISPDACYRTLKNKDGSSSNDLARHKAIGKV